MQLSIRYDLTREFNPERTKANFFLPEDICCAGEMQERALSLLDPGGTGGLLGARLPVGQNPIRPPPRGLQVRHCRLFRASGGKAFILSAPFTWAR